MIEKISAYKSSDGTVVGTIEDVQKHELKGLFQPEDFDHEGRAGGEVVEKMVGSIVAYRDKVVDILTYGPRSKPKACAINGGTKKRTKLTTIPGTPTAAQLAGKDHKK